MAEDIVKLLEEKLRDRPMKTMDPNTQSAGDENDKSSWELYHRAIIAAALAGLLEYSRKDENIRDLLNSHTDADYANKVFHQHFGELEQRIRSYSGYTVGNSRADFNFILQQLVEVVREFSSSQPQIAKDFISDQRANILAYLPGDLEAGSLLNNNTLDDRTHKMHGPFSDFMHWMEQIFSKGD